MLNDDAIAYTWMTLIIFFIVGAASVVATTELLNHFLNIDGGINDQIIAGEMTQQRANAIQFNLDMFSINPIWMLLGAFVFAISVAIRRREGR